MRLPFSEADARPLRILFLDLNAYFASVQQAEHPELRGKPVGVCAVEADTSSLIAASYEAKAFGVRGLMSIGEAKQRCPEIILVSGGHGIYSRYHQKVLDAVGTILPVDQVCSIDEMQFRLIGKEQTPEGARDLALKMKQAIHEHVSPVMHCSIGIAPNAFLAKLATDLQKPNGLVVIESSELPDRLRGLEVTEFTGINRRMKARLAARGIFSSDDLVEADEKTLRRAFGSIEGERWWYLLRGYEVDRPRRENQSLGHSHVLPPELRTGNGCHEVMVRLIQKATARLRSEGLFAGSVSFYVQGMRQSWEVSEKLSPTQDTVAITECFDRRWPSRNFERPLKVAVTFHDLKEREQVTFSLFDDEGPRVRLNGAVDDLNARFGKNTIYLGGVHGARDAAPERIAFQKVSLFKEGKDDDHD